ncbi:unnamed protein product [Urochloa decumbens]|uniref:Uncharacterized protein n=1 Tax=Urochloa decumbens TaxID=240449 RepID=A0ABC8XEY1_9POAL
MGSVEESERHGFEEELYESDEVRVVLDSFAGDTQVLDSFDAVDVESVAVAAEVDAADVEPVAMAAEVDAADALMLLLKTQVNTFQSDKEARFVAGLLVPLLVPSLYEEKDQDVRDVATDLHWISHGYVRGFGN